MIPLLAPHHAVLVLNTRLYLRCLADVDDGIALARPNGNTNSIAFLALHLLDSRCFLGGLVGVEAGHPFGALLEGVRGIGEMERFPPLAEVRASWQEVSAALADGLAMLSEEEVLRESSQRFPGEDRTIVGAVAFLLQHDSYHIGQMALLRRYFGLPPMRYS